MLLCCTYLWKGDSGLFLKRMDWSMKVSREDRQEESEMHNSFHVRGVQDQLTSAWKGDRWRLYSANTALQRRFKAWKRFYPKWQAVATHNSFTTPELGDTKPDNQEKAPSRQREILVCTLCNLTTEPSAQDAVEAKTINRFEKAVKDIMEKESISGY